MPLVLTPAPLVLMLVFGHISRQNYIGDRTVVAARPGDHCLCGSWCTITSRLSNHFGCRLPMRAVLGDGGGGHQFRLAGASVHALSDEIQRSLAVRSVTTPFALAAAAKPPAAA